MLHINIIIMLDIHILTREHPINRHSRSLCAVALRTELIHIQKV